MGAIYMSPQNENGLGFWAFIAIVLAIMAVAYFCIGLD